MKIKMLNCCDGMDDMIAAGNVVQAQNIPPVNGTGNF
jgi:hypothetical protein